jgi:hypothetical protein
MGGLLAEGVLELGERTEPSNQSINSFSNLIADASYKHRD